MPDDNTTFTSKVEEIKDIETPCKEDTESHAFNFSGRFWIALIFSVGFVAVVLASFFGKVPDATIFAGFASTAGMVVGNYMGQNKQATPQTKIV